MHLKGRWRPQFTQSGSPLDSGFSKAGLKTPHIVMVETGGKELSATPTCLRPRTEQFQKCDLSLFSLSKLWNFDKIMDKPAPLQTQTSSTSGDHLQVQRTER